MKSKINMIIFVLGIFFFLLLDSVNSVFFHKVSGIIILLWLINAIYWLIHGIYIIVKSKKTAI